MAEANRKWSPYSYGYNNPLRFIDSNGMFEDWVKNEETQKYQWMDNVTSSKDKDIPQGYKYVSSSDEDIVADLNLPQKLEVKTEIRTAAALDRDNKTGIVVGTKADAFICKIRRCELYLCT